MTVATARRPFAGLLVVALLASSRPALAASGASADERAEARYKDGEEAFRLGRYADAIAAFEDSYRLSLRVEILFNIGLANRKAYALEGKPEYLRRSLDIFGQFVKLATSDEERRAAARNIAELQTELSALEEKERVARLRGSTGPPALQTAARLSAEGHPKEALGQLGAQLKKGGNSVGVMADVYQLEGEISAEAQQPGLAVDSYEKLIAINPSFDLPRTAGAQARAAFQQARAFWAHQAAFGLSHAVPPPAEPGLPLALSVLVENDPLGLVTRVAVRYRRAGQRRFSVVSRVGGGEVVIPAVMLLAEGEGYRIEYYVQALDADNNILATIGGETAPLSFPVLTEEEAAELKKKSGPWYTSFWFWAGAGAIVAAGVATTAVVVSLPHGPPASDFPQQILTLKQ